MVHCRLKRPSELSESSFAVAVAAARLSSDGSAGRMCVRLIRRTLKWGACAFAVFLVHNSACVMGRVSVYTYAILKYCVTVPNVKCDFLELNVGGKCVFMHFFCIF